MEPPPQPQLSGFPCTFLGNNHAVLANICLKIFNCASRESPLEKTKTLLLRRKLWKIRSCATGQQLSWEIRGMAQRWLGARQFYRNAGPLLSLTIGYSMQLQEIDWKLKDACNLKGLTIKRKCKCYLPKVSGIGMKGLSLCFHSVIVSSVAGTEAGSPCAFLHH